VPPFFRISGPFGPSAYSLYAWNHPMCGISCQTRPMAGRGRVRVAAATTAAQPENKVRGLKAPRVTISPA
jgi:hypothetical protein